MKKAHEFNYYNLDRLTGVTYHDSDTEAFAMDDLGNREFLLDAIYTMNKMKKGCWSISGPRSG